MVYGVKARIQGWLRELCIYGDWDEQRITLDGQNRNICTCKHVIQEIVFDLLFGGGGVNLTWAMNQLCYMFIEEHHQQ